MILAILQARCSSSRLPQKVLKKIINRPMLELQIERIKLSKKIDKLIVATSTDASDLAIVELCKKNNVGCFCGSLDNVLERFYQAAKLYSPEHVVRLTGDCPLIDPAVIDKTIEEHLQGNFDYTCNCSPPTFPDGLDVEVMRFAVLTDVYQQATLPSHKEHVTVFIRQHPQEYKLHTVRNTVDLSNLRWTVDNQEDFDFVTQIYENLYFVNPQFLMQDILNYLDGHHEIEAANQKYHRNEGLERSFKKDAEYLARSKEKKDE